MGLPHGYWVPLTLIVVVAALSQGDTKKGRQRLVGSVGAMIITIPLSFLPLPAWAFYVVALLLLIPAFAMYKKSYGIYTFLESAAVVLLVSSGQDISRNADARAIAAVIGVAIVFALALVARAVFARLPDVTDPAAVDSALVSRVVSSYAVPERIPREARTQISPNIGHIGAAEDAASRWDAAGNCHVIYDSGH